MEWIFPNADPGPVKFSDVKCSENSRLSELLDKYINLNAEPFEGSKALTYYKAAGYSGIKILLRGKYCEVVFEWKKQKYFSGLNYNFNIKRDKQNIGIK